MHRIAVLTIVFSSYLFAQTQFDFIRPPMPQTLFLSVQIPKSDTMKWFGPKMRFAACTRPEAKAYINNVPVKVYPSGAFVGLQNFSYGKNILRFTVKLPNGDSLFREFTINRPEPMKNSPRDNLVIEDVFMEPSEELWLEAGDVLEAKFKGSPGWEAYFDIPDVASDIPMRELSAKEGGGFAGIYFGKYTVQPTDEVRGIQLVYHLRKSFWSKEKAYSKAKISILPKELPRVAEIIGKSPFLNAGLGTNRLGGAKLGFLQPGVLVTITGKVGSQYRVRLSESMEAWLPEEYAKFLPPNTPLPHSEAGAITVTGNSDHDVVTLALSTKLPYTSEQLVEPNAIAINIYGATSNTNWIEQNLSAQGIQNVTWRQVSAEQYRLTIALKHQQHWGYDVDYSGTMLRVQVARPPLIVSRDSILSGMTIAVDAGHGGNDNHGSIGATGVYEMNVTMSIANHLDAILRSKGAKVFLTRSDTEGISMADRIEQILNSDAQILLSIHCNSCGDASDPLMIRGTSVYYRYIGFKPLADITYVNMLKLGLQQFGKIGSFNFMLNSLTQIPNVLVETAFISNPEEEMQLLDDGFRTKIAEQLANSLEEFVRTFAR